MPTISEIEAERAKILAEIEERAKTNAQGSGNAEATSLKDWLSAAQEVVPQSTLQPTSNNDRGTDPGVTTSFSQAMQQSLSPEETRSAETTSQNRSVNTQTGNEVPMPTTPKNSSNSSIGVILLLTSILTIFSLILYFGYRDLTQKISDIREQSNAEMQEIRKALENGGMAEAAQKDINKMDERIQFLESQLSLIQDQLSELSSQGQRKIDFSEIQTLNEEDKKALGESLGKTLAFGGVTERVLDEKLRQYNEQLAKQFELRLDQKLKPIMNKLNLASQRTSVTVNEPEEDTNQVAKIDVPQTPDAPEVKTPLMEKPLLKMVEPKPVKEAESQIEPVSPITKPIIEQEPQNTEQKKSANLAQLYQDVLPSDVEWVKSKPKNNFTLQLASMKTAKDLQRLVANKNLKNTKILPQVRRGTVNYILLLDAVKDRDSAENIAADIKKQTGISPWIRKIQDIQTKLK